jgi:protein TonB
LEELLVRNYGANPLAGRHLTDDGLWRGLDIYVTGDRDLFPLVRDQAAYPEEAVMRGLSQGYVDVEFTVTRTGSTRDVKVVESSTPVFESAAIQAAESFRYKPRLVDGEPVEVVVRDRIEFQSGDIR